MATKSILKNIYVREKKQFSDLINALERAEKKKGKEVKLSKSVTQARGEDIKKIFGKSESDDRWVV